MNRYSVWKYLMILSVFVLGVLYFLPNLYGEDPAIQVSGIRSTKVDASTMSRIESELKTQNVAIKAYTQNDAGLLIRFNNTDDQLKAQDAVSTLLGNNYTVALNLAPLTPAWLKSINALPMYLGLDLRGGVHFLMEVDKDAAINQAYERYTGDFRTILREKSVRYLTVSQDKDAASGASFIRLKFKTPEVRDEAKKVLSKEFRELQYNEEDIEGYYNLRAVIPPPQIIEIQKFAVQQNITTLRNRVNELGVAEPLIQQQGADRIVVQLPGVQDTAHAKEILGATATLEFRLADEEHNAAEASTGMVPPGLRLYRERSGNPILLQNQVMLTGDYIVDASSGIDQDSGGSAVFISLDSKGGRIFLNATKDNVGKLMAVVFIETKTDRRVVNGETVRVKRQVEEVINVARIRDRLGSRFQITGLDNSKEAKDLALLLRAGALAAPIEIVEERTVGPSMGADNIAKGFNSTLLGFGLIALFMTIYYLVFGFISAIALSVNLVLLVAILSALQATLTLPGMAGIALTVGMAVDSNVLIFERIREELRNGASPQAAIDAGFERAWATIFDSNITIFIAGFSLFWLGSGPVRGFAVVLCLGILTSMFSAILVSRAMVNLTYGNRRIKKLAIG